MQSLPPQALASLRTRVVGAGWRVSSRSGVGGTYSRLTSRFLPAADEEVGVLYVADSPATALVEYFGSQRVVSVDSVRDRVLTQIEFNRTFTLVDLSSPDVFDALGLDEAAVHRPSYSESQDLASQLLAAGL